jgi:hypothetical protein
MNLTPKASEVGSANGCTSAPTITIVRHVLRFRAGVYNLMKMKRYRVLFWTFFATLWIAGLFIELYRASKGPHYSWVVHVSDCYHAVIEYAVFGEWVAGRMALVFPLWMIALHISVAWLLATSAARVLDHILDEILTPAAPCTAPVREPDRGP